MKYSGLNQAQVDDRNAKLKQEEANREARAYLAGTDWYVIRFNETGIPIPADVLQKRKIARSTVV